MLVVRARIANMIKHYFTGLNSRALDQRVDSQVLDKSISFFELLEPMARSSPEKPICWNVRESLFTYITVVVSYTSYMGYYSQVTNLLFQQLSSFHFRCESFIILLQFT